MPTRSRDELIASGVLTAREAQLIDLPDTTVWEDRHLRAAVDQVLDHTRPLPEVPCAACGTPTVDVHSRLGRACIPCLHAQVQAAERSMAMLIPNGTEVHDLGNGIVRYSGTEPPSFLPLARLAYD